MKKCLYKYNGIILMLITRLDTYPLNEVLCKCIQPSHAVLEANLVQMKMCCNEVTGARTVGLIGINKLSLRSERCARASLRGGVFNLQAPVNTVNEGQEEKPAIYT